ncbi:transcriptional regulator [candidate division LCP-89 bacterium B3_LCP]|uniref:Transcriptional regulator n=1 Tax=candidate division LCP-89 bacterium B3_LCP TaxID=2012998 RepID=A0A532UZT5_UNCL8|nr:MAG: transcriptional regulator [candidate division LCP-89 bacterium B3_LCP]
MPKEKSKKKPGVFSKRDLPHFKKLILKKRENLLDKLSNLKEKTLEKSYQDYTGEHSTYSFHMADQGTDAQEREKAFMFASREGRYLSYLDRALELIEEGKYGFCNECGEPIAKARLEAVPTAKLCVECKSKKEE